MSANREIENKALAPAENKAVEPAADSTEPKTAKPATKGDGKVTVTLSSHYRSGDKDYLPGKTVRLPAAEANKVIGARRGRLAD